MAKVKIQGHASGTGILTVTAPNTSTDRTITLPDETGTLSVGSSIDDNGNATAITIDSSENVGIGVTPETTHSTVRALQIGLGGRVWAHTSNASRAALSGNAYIDSSNVDKYINTDEATQYIQEDGLHKFQVAASGSADAAITWTKALEITNAGLGLSQFTAKAWWRFDGTGTVAIADSHNISSVGDTGTGDYRIYYDVDLDSPNHSAHIQSQTASDFSEQWDNIKNQNAAYVDFDHKEGGSNADSARIMGLVFGD